MTVPFPHAWASGPERYAIAIALTIAFSVLARSVRGVTFSGMLAGGAACFLLFAGAGPAAFATLAALFVLTWVSTRFGYRRKQELGLAERREGRNGWQVAANLVVGAAASVLFALTGRTAWLVAISAALAEAATDTIASEIGQSRNRTAVLITTGQRVPAGSDGGITLAGTIAGTAAGVAIAAVAAASGLIPPSQLWMPVVAGFVGMLADSLLGATLQRKKWMSNETVNLFGTLAAGLFASLFAG